MKIYRNRFIDGFEFFPIILFRTGLIPSNLNRKITPKFSISYKESSLSRQNFEDFLF